MSSPQPASKPHYMVLDGLRGVAAVMVVMFHLFEAHATSHLDQMMNHGYLAVDFFFLLSGFVIGYAYDDRWGRMSLGDFFRRRLVRLQPMIIIGMIVGAAMFYFQDSPMWPSIHEVPVWKMLLIMLVGFTLIPVTPSMDIRGWSEMHPLNGPAWSLFYEYIANILYAVVVRRFTKTALAVLVFLAGAALIHLGLTSPTGDIIGGWAIDAEQLHIGFTRLMYPFFAGLLLSRIGKLIRVGNAFLWCSLMIAVVLSFPRLGGTEHLWFNGLYDSLSVILIFPVIVLMGAGETLKNGPLSHACKFLGDISYPIYITHYPIVYTYTAWVSRTGTPFSEAWPLALLSFVCAIALAYASLRLYDLPVRKWLGRKVLKQG